MQQTITFELAMQHLLHNKLQETHAAQLTWPFVKKKRCRITKESTGCGKWNVQTTLPSISSAIQILTGVWPYIAATVYPGGTDPYV